ncbi:MAG: NAD-dependent epimerase/dehydratase family protein [Candidatus Thermoplasmatota archaeon]|nr:NAD-dependent epimerase/dehydratase family protein [Candidatus Thermoplasmatota archaeon]
MNVLVTGASGFIGRYLVDDLVKHGYHVKALTRQFSLKIKGAEVVRGDITQPEQFLSAFDNVEAVFHNAAYATDYGKKSEIYKSNIEGTMNVAEACIKKGIKRIIYTGTAGVYGFPNTNEEITEKSAKKPLNAYHKSKFEGEKILRNCKDLSVSVVRPPLVLGAGGKGTKVILERIKKGNMIYIGTGDQYISLAHPKDVAQCLRLALENDKKEDVFNVVSFVCKIKKLFNEIAVQLDVGLPNKNVSYSLAYAAAFFSEIFATKEPSLTRFRVKSLGTTRRVSCDKAKKELGYEPKFDLQSTANDMVSWYRKSH